MTKKLPIFIVLLLVALFTGCSSYQPLLADRPIRFDQNRRELTRAYLQDRYGIRQEGVGIQPEMIVLHWTAIPTVEASFDAFYPSELPDSRGDITSAGALNVSAHYLVDRDGTILQLMPDTVMARHVIGLNHCAIGIENVGGTPETPLTKAQLQANEWLVRRLAAKYPIRYLIGHYEYTRFEGHPLWLEQDSGYRTEKTDPGVGFMKKIRNSVRDLGLEPAPEKTAP
ncbi:N-acetylmuramoyl-L-alanine amidase [Robiginitalea sp. SC105]|uniref:N-acetylmuramoyl-L-alanine amidase n=1 Tax=Robiginitalea sp. SC105 TaxID=2762332 RepID=UPI001639672C|nr:peptidoglycan recognition family protein [Robiginitalea sp. SC105]MBC2840571.1 N-acetylmuramoyl-L-alanine amidase [Robiginitalea sp. SC105]